MVQWYLKHYKHLLILVLLAVVISGLVWLASHTNIMREVENKTIDFRFRLSPHPEDADSSIVLVVVDQGSLDYVAKNMGWGWPWPRQYYGVICDYLTHCNVASLGYDFLFDQPDYDRSDLETGYSDSSMAASLAASDRDILGMVFAHDPNDLELADTLAVPDTGLLDLSHVPDWVSVQAPIPEFTASAHLGGISLMNDRDSVIRRAPLLYKFKGRYYPSLGLAMYLREKGNTASALRGIPIDQEGCLTLNWHGDGGPRGVFPYLPFTTLLECARAYRDGEEPPVPDKFFRGRHILVGVTASGLLDLKTSPYTFGVPGMEIWATQLSNLLGGRYIVRPPAWLELLLLFTISMLILVLVTRVPGSLTLPGALALLLLLSVGCWLAFDVARFSFNYSAGVSVLLLSLLLILTISYVAEGRHKRELRNIFARYLHPDRVKEIEENPDKVKMGGVLQQATVMFTDIKDFTTFCEGKVAEEVVGYLNAYFDSLANIILNKNGLLDKYAGDGLMAVFGVPVKRDEHAVLACEAALEHLALAETLHAEGAHTAVDKFHMNTRIGINSGEIMAGNIGCERRMEYTSIGDPVNLASRLEGVNKLFGTHVIISQSTLDLTGERFLCRKLGRVQVKGKSEVTTIHELMGDKALLDMADYRWLDEFERGRSMYEQGDFAGAMQALAPLADKPLEDQPSQYIIARCQDYLKNPPETWNGIYELHGK